MEKRKVTTIPATINKFTAKPMDGKKKRRVAGYARVSTDHEDQQTSYEAQVDYYTTYIQMIGSSQDYIRTRALVLPTQSTEMVSIR